MFTESALLVEKRLESYKLVLQIYSESTFGENDPLCLSECLHTLLVGFISTFPSLCLSFLLCPFASCTFLSICIFIRQTLRHFFYTCLIFPNFSASSSKYQADFLILYISILIYYSILFIYLFAFSCLYPTPPSSVRT